MSAGAVGRDTLRAARDDLRAFGDAVGVPLTEWHAVALALACGHDGCWWSPGDG